MKRILAVMAMVAALAVSAFAQQPIQQSTTAYKITFLMVDSSDHITGKTGLTPTVTISKAGASFGSPSGAVTELSGGWYVIAGNATDTGTLGELLLHATSAGADPTDMRVGVVVAFNPQDSVRMGLTALPNAAAGASTGLLINGSNSGTVTLAALTVTGSFTISDGLLVARSSSNTSAITATGNGTGSGAVFTSGSGATGDGLAAIAASTNGNGWKATGAGTGAGGLLTSGGGATGDAFKLVAASTNGNGLNSAGVGTGSGFLATSGAGATGNGITATSAATAGQGISATGNGIGHGFLATSGGGATGDGFKAISAATNGNGFNGVGTGTGADIKGSGLEQLVSKAVASSFSSTVVNNSVFGYLSTSSATTNYDRTTMSSEAAYTNAPTVAGMATAIWQDTTSGDFTTGSSIGKSLFTGSAPGTGGGLLLAGSNAATTFATLTSTGAFTVNSVVNVPQTGDNYARLGAPAGASVSADIAAVKTLLPTALVGGRMDSSLGAVASGAITRAGFAADTGLQTIRSNTAAAGGSTSITLDASASASNSYYLNDKVYITGGTGVGQARTISAYNGTSKVATVTAWVTNPDNTSTFAILPDDAVSGASAPTASQVATAVWQDLMAGGDFGTSSSIGKLFADNITGNAYTRLGAPAGASISADIAAAKVDTAAIKTKTDFLPSATAGAAGGLFIAGTNAATTITTGLTTHFIGTVDAVTAVNGLASNVITAASIASDADTEIENAVLNATTAGHTTAGSIGKAIGDASSAGDPWSTALPGSYASGTAGYIIGNNIQPVKTVKKGEAFTDVPIWMLSTTGAAVTGLSTSQISCQVSIDHGSWAAVTDTTETEIGLGKYVVDLSSGETNGNSISLDCSATGASHYRTNITPQR